MRSALAALALLLAAGPVLAAASPLDSWAGVYRRSKTMDLRDGVNGGKTYVGEDILEIVRIDDGRAYVRVRLMFTNAHSCSLWGVARRESGGLVYRGQPNSFGTCTLSIQREKDQIVLRDPQESCRVSHCGARGWMDKASFPLSSRRSISYMARLKASPQYAEALAEDAKR